MPMILSLLPPVLEWLRLAAARRRDQAALRELDDRRVTRLRVAQEYGHG